MIAVCGECLIDFIPQEVSSPYPRKKNLSKKITLPRYQACIGGSPLNTAIAISRLDTPVTMISRLSRDAFGTAIEKHLALNKVGITTLSHGEEPTTIGFVIPRKNGGEDFVFYAQRSADRFIRIKHLPTPLPSQVRHVHFSSIALQMDPCGHTYEHLMKREYRHRTISLDPNVRPLFIRDREEYRQRVERMVGMVGVFRASDQDMKYLYPLSTPEAMIKKLLPQFRPPGITILTLGRKGAVIFYRSPSRVERIHAPIYKTPLVDTVGAGDSFTGAFLHVLYHHQIIGGKPKPVNRSLLQKAIDFAMKAAAVNCSREGCDPPFLSELK